MTNIRTYISLLIIISLFDGKSATSTKRQNNSFSSSSTANLNTLLLVQVIFRHGDRSPLFDFPKNPVNISEKWPLGMGQLTDKGKMQGYELGQFLRGRYAGFIRDTFYPKDIYAQSSETDRTMMTGQTVLAGLYPVKGASGWNPSVNWSPIPIRTIPHDSDNKIGFGADCYNYKMEWFFFVNYDCGKHFDDEHTDFYKFVSNRTGLPLCKINFETVSDLYDTLYIQDLNGFPMPDWSKKPFLKQKPYIMKSMAEFTFSVLTNTNRMMKLRGGPIFRSIIRNMDNRQKNKFEKDSTKMFLYSGHDTTISTLLQVLGVYNGLLVPYTCAIIIELHKATSNNGCPSHEKEDIFVQVFYRNCTKAPPVELFIPDCGNDATVCELEKLKNLKDHLLQGNWRQECGPRTIRTDSNECSGDSGIFCAVLKLFTPMFSACYHPLCCIWEWITSIELDLAPWTWTWIYCTNSTSNTPD